MMKDELKILEAALEEITRVARGFGLDFYDMYFEVCPAEIIYTFGAYGMPTRFSHWSFGKNYHKMKTQYDYNLSRIYEMVINSDPCYAFLLEGNSIIQNKMVIAHVLGHCDFFKNNRYFSRTSRKMVETMASSADRFRGYEFRYGKDKVESFIDAVTAIQEHVDFYRREQVVAPDSKKIRGKGDCGSSCGVGGCDSHDQQHRETPYDDLWALDKKPHQCAGKCKEKKKRFPAEPEKDVLLFIMNEARNLEEWQRDIISTVRDEMLYFLPQMQTKIINEGWASYWHLRIMRELDLTGEETLEFAKMHAGVIQTSKIRLNPYFLGLKIFEDIEKRWDSPTGEERKKYARPGGEGREKIFEVRELDNDISFIRNYLTKELIEELDLYVYKKVGYEWKVVDKNWESIRDTLVQNLANSGFPYIVVEDGDFNLRAELLLKHLFEGIELDVYYLERTLPHVQTLWGRPVHLETVIDNKKILFSYNGDKISKKFI
ncbi:MAG: SpoVR family protein [Bacillota bacterium]